MRRGPGIGLIAGLWLAGLWLAGFAALAGAPGAELIGAYVWRDPADRFGGLSGLSVSDGGTRLTAIGDRGILIGATIRRDGAAVAGIADVQVAPLLSSKGAALAGRVADAEGLAILPGGAICISYENVHRVACHAGPEAPARVLDRPAAFGRMPRNGGFEALAADAAGHLYAIPEAVRDAQGRIPVHRWDGTGWSSPFTLPGRGGFRPVGADIGPDGRLYLLERDWGPLGFRSRLRRWDIGPGGPRGETILLETGTGTHDNLEGISVWRDDTGRLRATLVSDDNFKAFQRTEIVEYALPD